MPSVTFQQILDDAARKNIVFDKTKESLSWFAKTAGKYKNTSGPEVMKEFGKADFLNVSSIAPGKMYFFQYDPKHKATLPYYDLFPCVFPIEAYGNGSFLAINLHYLHPTGRVKLMDALYQTQNKATLAENVRLNISYNILKSAAQYKLFKPCIKRYLKDHLRSKFLPIPYESWPVAMFLPVHDFQKAKASKVWQDSWDKAK